MWGFIHNLYLIDLKYTIELDTKSKYLNESKQNLELSNTLQTPAISPTVAVYFTIFKGFCWRFSIFFYIFLIVNESHVWSQTSNDLIYLKVLCVYRKPDVSCSSVPWTSVVVQKHVNESCSFIMKSLVMLVCLETTPKTNNGYITKLYIVNNINTKSSQVVICSTTS